MSRWRLLAVTAVAAVVTGCGIPSEDAPKLADRDDVPFGLLDPTGPTTATTSPSAPSSPTPTRTVCFLDGEVLVEAPVGEPAQDGVSGLVDALADPPDGIPLATAVADRALVGAVTVTRGIAQVDLAELFSQLPASDQRRLVGQLVCTLTAQPGIGSVAFTLAGVPVDVPTGDGSLSSRPVSRDDYREVIR